MSPGRRPNRTYFALRYRYTYKTEQEVVLMKIKRLLTLFLAACLLISGVPFSAAAAKTNTTGFQSGKVLSGK